MLSHSIDLEALLLILSELSLIKYMGFSIVGSPNPYIQIEVYQDSYLTLIKAKKFPLIFVYEDLQLLQLCMHFVFWFSIFVH